MYLIFEENFLNYYYFSIYYSLKYYVVKYSKLFLINFKIISLYQLKIQKNKKNINSPKHDD